MKDEKGGNKMAEKQNKKQVIIPLAPLGCVPDRNCCHYGSDCPAEVAILPSGALSFRRCGC